jgi:hypothetical protein
MRLHLNGFITNQLHFGAYLAFYQRAFHLQFEVFQFSAFDDERPVHVFQVEPDEPPV